MKYPRDLLGYGQNLPKVTWPNSAKIGMFADFNLRINRLGIIENLEMRQTSGDNAFDRAALNAIRKYKQIKYVRNLDDQTFQAYFSNFTFRFRPE